MIKYINNNIRSSVRKLNPILRAIVEILSAKKCKVILASPTGRAAQRLSESAKKEARTIHRLLKFDPSSGSFFHNREKLLSCDCIIIDETSMVDTQLAASLFDAIPSTAHLILVGDSDQLPSVGSGNILSDLKHASFSKVVRLDTIYRQAKESRIITTAHNILKGVNQPEMTLQSMHHLDPKIDFNFIEAEDDERMLKAILYLVKDYLPKVDPNRTIDPIQDIQILSPMHKGSAGIQNLNAALQNCLNNSTKAKRRMDEEKDYQSAKQIFFKEKTQTKKVRLVVAGGVAANISIRENLSSLGKKLNFETIYPNLKFCGDNAAMIAWAGIKRFKKKLTNTLNISARSRWPLDENAPYMKGPGLKF